MLKIKEGLAGLFLLMAAGLGVLGLFEHGWQFEQILVPVCEDNSGGITRKITPANVGCPLGKAARLELESYYYSLFEVIIVFDGTERTVNLNNDKVLGEKGLKFPGQVASLVLFGAFAISFIPLSNLFLIQTGARNRLFGHLMAMKWSFAAGLAYAATAGVYSFFLPQATQNPSAGHAGSYTGVHFAGNFMSMLVAAQLSFMAPVMIYFSYAREDLKLSDLEGLKGF